MNLLKLGVTCIVTFWAGLPLALADSPRPNVLLIVSDDQRPDTIAALGNTTIRTPNLDSLVQRGTTFTRATCANPICTPSRAEILTGASGFENGSLDFGQGISSDVTTLAETLRKSGYRTGYVGKWHNKGLPKDYGYQRTAGMYRGGGGKWWKPQNDSNGRPVTGYRGWIFYDENAQKQPERGVGLHGDISESFADAAISLIEADQPTENDQPFFVHVNFTAPHDPLFLPTDKQFHYQPEQITVPKNFLPQHPFDHGNFDGRDEQLFEWPRTKDMIRDELAVYYAVISHMDAQIGRILESLEDTNQTENTLVIFTSDHGLAIGSHGLRGKQNMYEHTIGVPLMMVGPGVPTNTRRTAQCYLRDIFPTVCDLVGLDIPKPVGGRSLKPVLAGDTEEIYSAVFGYYRAFQRMIRTPEWKLIRYPQVDREQLFHLTSDPHELTNLIDDPQHEMVADQLRQQMQDWQKSVGDKPETAKPD
ncbi:sulfatase-like hydrolase/transferase [Thalassoroseus pseudoceratinae]|uniref:sulfatase-like hydrolase/transferase n=1 Tax=Thalassoroseus pseudoceratinae TaxID=2713176 RepID=UPI00141DA8B7|nr:sulfatase-like hydrolase/transferase [Thalassoroseus pseudoceratinae]